ncbi:MAG TPA: amidohydrolase, partial [Chitinophagaceae bacterium]|nr:amidohydrolase [Chitinophagaceae bacterium]
MKHILTIFFSIIILNAFSQETVYPAKIQTETIALTNATIHIGNGDIIENGMIVFSKGKIIDIRPTAPIADIKV